MINILKDGRYNSTVFAFIVSLIVWLPFGLRGMSWQSLDILEYGKAIKWYDILFLLGVLLLGLRSNRFTTNISLYQHKTSFPMFLYMCLIPLLNPQWEMGMGVVSAICIFIACKQIYFSFYPEDIAYHYFAVGILMSIAGIFSPPIFLLLPATYISMVLFRPFRYKEWILLSLGYLLPTLLCVAVFYVVNGNVSVVDHYIQELINIHPFFSSPIFITCSVLWMICVLSSIYSTGKAGIKVPHRILHQSCIVFSSNIIILMLIYPHYVQDMTFTLAMFYALNLAGAFMRTSKKKLANILIYTLVLSSIVVQILI